MVTSTLRTTGGVIGASIPTTSGARSVPALPTLRLTNNQIFTETPGLTPVFGPNTSAPVRSAPPVVGGGGGTVVRTAPFTGTKFSTIAEVEAGAPAIQTATPPPSLLAGKIGGMGVARRFCVKDQTLHIKDAIHFVDTRTILPAKDLIPGVQVGDILASTLCPIVQRPRCEFGKVAGRVGCVGNPDNPVANPPGPRDVVVPPGVQWGQVVAVDDKIRNTIGNFFDNLGKLKIADAFEDFKEDIAHNQEVIARQEEERDRVTVDIDGNVTVVKKDPVVIINPGQEIFDENKQVGPPGPPPPSLLKMGVFAGAAYLLFKAVTK